MNKEEANNLLYQTLDQIQNSGFKVYSLIRMRSNKTKKVSLIKNLILKEDILVDE